MNAKAANELAQVSRANGRLLAMIEVAARQGNLFLIVNGMTKGEIQKLEELGYDVVPGRTDEGDQDGRFKISWE